MKPSELVDLYEEFGTTTERYVPGCCKDISLLLSPQFDGEAAFYRLVLWGYVLVEEAAKVALDFLIQLPPLRGDTLLRKNVGALRTFLVHNLEIGSSSDRRTTALVQRWFNEACGERGPTTGSQFGLCSEVLGSEVGRALRGAIDASHLLGDRVDGPRLVSDLAARVGGRWEAYRFDELIDQCCRKWGGPVLDRNRFRNLHLDRWREVALGAEEPVRESLVRERVETDLLSFIGESLPQGVRDRVAALCSTRAGVLGALVLAQEARASGVLLLSDVLEWLSQGACLMFVRQDWCLIACRRSSERWTKLTTLVALVSASGAAI